LWGDKTPWGRIFKEVYMKPHLRGPFNDVDCICVGKEDQIVGIKIVKSAKEISEFNRKNRSIFNDVWFLQSVRLKSYPSKVTVISPTKGKIPNDFIKQINDNTVEDEVKFKFIEELGEQ
jgi:hypothetical protein